MTSLTLPSEIRALRRAGALFVINHSGGKDSQAMTILLRSIIPEDQLLILHATLGEIEWPGTIPHIEATTEDLPIRIAEAQTDFFAMVRRRQRFPTPEIRQCTSDLKRGPIEREIRRFLKEYPEFGGKIVNCIGLRAEESPRRAKRAELTQNTRQSKAGRYWMDWCPILDLTEDEVFSVIARAGQTPHWAYAAGMSRLSCSFCIMASRGDLRTAAELRPDLLRTYIDLESEIGHRFHASCQPLAVLVGRA